MTDWLPDVGERVASASELHVYRLDLGALAERASTLRSLLAPDELARAQRFVYDRHRFPFIAARATLRRLLGRYLGLPATAVAFDYNPFGKPELRAGQSPIALTFNLSHANERALIAITAERAVGVDVEHIRADFTGEEIWERFFSVREREALRALPEEVRPLAFFQCWTRKEAYIKGAGPGLSIPLHSFDVTLGPGVPAELLATRPDAAEAARWAFWALEPGDGYAGAVAVERRPGALTLRTFDWPTEA